VKPVLFRDLEDTRTIMRKERTMEEDIRHATITFLDNSKLRLTWPKQGSKDAQIFATQLKHALEADRFIAEVEGQLMVVPMRNVKHMIVSPAPKTLPQGIIRKARLVSQE
jgi:hypothetical protein